MGCFPHEFFFSLPILFSYSPKLLQTFTYLETIANKVRWGKEEDMGKAEGGSKISLASYP